jgi:2-hydroxy-3-keto-5-methylthiopentenyl-1-phosphate phosphatase
VAYVGDGMSDLSAARVADLLFACGSLAKCCEQEGLPYHVFTGMRDVHDWLQVNPVVESR